MAKQRIVDTKFWDDSLIVGLKPMEKLVFLYLLTNPLTNISGVYELPLRRVAFDTGFSEKAVNAVLDALETSGKLIRWNGWIGMVNFIKYQNYTNPKIRQGIIAEMKRAPTVITDRLSIGLQKLGISIEGSSHSNSNLNFNFNSNPNSNAFPLRELSTVLSQEVQEKRKSLVSKWRV